MQKSDEDKERDAALTRAQGEAPVVWSRLHSKANAPRHQFVHAASATTMANALSASSGVGGSSDAQLGASGSGLGTEGASGASGSAANSDKERRYHETLATVTATRERAVSGDVISNYNHSNFMCGFRPRWNTISTIRLQLFR